ncbi:50S ribosomal protein L30 [Leptolinea tardivitalis]|uniref:Large ribosomal subunit protein uL30 n=1 Tax=Leptolinea tardivitalis TaxID=229920 RepID=A0A0N8GL52_9CHLR|nr:50S ribosomal protein L30 [Leptolinea tardivitalis]KPL71530.1 50S ribosomal protein L30 [Leptolinea tardivitalis]GAP19838.1 LSU ribosomal protein L30P [Leptolinea tardivitalis]
MTKKAAPEKKVRVTLVRSVIGSTERTRATVKALGLHRLHQTVEHIDTPVLRGMMAKVSHLIEVEEQVEK